MVAESFVCAGLSGLDTSDYLRDVNAPLVLDQIKDFGIVALACLAASSDESHEPETLSEVLDVLDFKTLLDGFTRHLLVNAYEFGSVGLHRAGASSRHLD